MPTKEKKTVKPMKKTDALTVELTVDGKAWEAIVAKMKEQDQGITAANDLAQSLGRRVAALEADLRTRVARLIDTTDQVRLEHAAYFSSTERTFQAHHIRLNKLEGMSKLKNATTKDLIDALLERPGAMLITGIDTAVCGGKILGPSQIVVIPTPKKVDP